MRILNNKNMRHIYLPPAGSEVRRISFQPRARDSKLPGPKVLASCVFGSSTQRITTHRGEMSRPGSRPGGFPGHPSLAGASRVSSQAACHGWLDTIAAVRLCVFAALIFGFLVIAVLGIPPIIRPLLWVQLEPLFTGLGGRDSSATEASTLGASH